ncbi:Uncharacterised protein [Raoultella planticola]|uniref:Uncharacterized protein n=1 Tax=Raoultella planticola TaxID=575 RepID=A0A485AWN7_RAOPL|nr:Uncharacterised protein [Raoultella planticola]
MSAINEQTKWEDEVYLLAREDRVEGGIYGPSNKQARQLANRTRYLKTAVESLQDYRDYTFFMTAEDPDGTVAGLAVRRRENSFAWWCLTARGNCWPLSITRSTTARRTG